MSSTTTGDGRACIVSIRPQDIDIADASNGSEPSLAGTVVDIQFLGGAVKLMVDIGADKPLTVALPGRRDMAMPTLGSALRLSVPPHAVRTFQPEAGA